jgi:hypothetical protein
MQFDELVSQVNQLIDDPTSEDLSKLEWMTITNTPAYVSDRASGIYLTRMFLALGEDGIKRLENLLGPFNGWENHGRIIQTIYLAHSKHLVPFIDQKINARPDIRQPVITDSMATFARDTFENIVLRMSSDQWIRQSILAISYHEGIVTHNLDGTENAYAPVTQDIFDIMARASMKRMLTDFAAIIQAKGDEEVYQKFLEEHLVLLDPLAKKVLFKQRLGKEYVTDFVIERLDDRHFMVEIEKPHTPLFTRKMVDTINGPRLRNDFSSFFTHALGQILDFQQWVEKHHEYANDDMKGIFSPPWLLVIGLRSNLEPDEREKLERLNINMRGNIQILCFDDLLTNGQSLYDNLYKK